MPVSLPENIKATAEARARAAGFSDLGAYFAALIESGAGQPIDAATEAALVEGLAQPGREYTRAMWDEKVRRFEQRMRERGGSGQ
ncbi:MAG TPA: hypothetical protein VEA69_03955 [Tepidisphaeraceae bacterium]|nr:hypothetical protein [Tepidisphaeraceae bacterium]